MLAAVVLVLAAFAATVAPASAATNCTPDAGWGTNRPDLAAQVLTLVNQYRASIEIGPLSVSAPLTASAEWKSLHMAGYNYFAHNDPAPPVARSPFTRMGDCGYSGGGMAENIAYGYASAQSVMTGWLNSDGHRVNIENPAYTVIGIGVAAKNGSGALYWTQNFGTTGGSSSPPPPPPPPPPPAPPSPPPSSPPASPPASPPPPSPPAAAPKAPVSAVSPVTSPSTPSAPTAPASQQAAGGGAVGPVVGPIGAKRVSTTTVVAGSKTTAKVEILSLATKRRVTAGSVHCRAVVDGKRLRVIANVFDDGLATCAWRVPRAAKGKVLHGAIGVQVGTTNALRLFVRPIR
jgi:uncharacterized protein YkwD